jgi:hypothetical protein
MPQPRPTPRKRNARAPTATIDEVICTVRGERVILDVELAKIYGVQTRILKQGVRRNREKFPSDFLFELTPTEAASMQSASGQTDVNSRSQTVILKQGGQRETPAFRFHRARRDHGRHYSQ